MEENTGEPIGKPEWMQNGDIEARLPYIAHIARLAEYDRRFVGLWYWLLKRRLAEETSVPIGPQPPGTLSGCVLDFDDEKLSVQKSIDEADLKRGRGEFLLAIRETPSCSRTRIIMVEKDQNAADFIFGGNDAPTPLDHEIVEALGSKYVLHPLYFSQMICNDPSSDVDNKEIPNGFERCRLQPFESLGIPEDPLMEAVPYVSFVLRFNYDRKNHHGDASWAGRTFPKLWITIKKDPDNITRNVVIVHMSHEENMAFGMIKGCPKYHFITQIITDFQNFSSGKIMSANRNPLEYLGPFLKLLERQFEIQLDECIKIHKLWLGKPPCAPSYALKNLDGRLLCTWREIRCLIESFEVIVSSIDQQWQAAEKLLKLSRSNKRRKFYNRYQIIVSNARLLERHIRDEVQVNVGNLSLQESRRSIQQADSVGKLSFLAFVFFPISLATSFFGMNIQELTGTGATWKIFFASAATLCGTLLLICAWLWRDSGRVKFTLKTPRIFWISLLWVRYMPINDSRRRKHERKVLEIELEVMQWRDLW